MSTSSLYDVLIIGSGPAGLSAALALGRVRRTALVLSSEEFRNAKAPALHGVISRDGESPAEFLRISREQIAQKYQKTISFEHTKIVSIRKKEIQLHDHDGEALYDAFEAEDSSGRVFRGKKMILATGSRDIFPDIEGFAENWGENIYQCLLCDGFERTNHPSGVGVLAFPDRDSYGHLALRVLSFDPTRVVMFTNGHSLDFEDECLGQAIARGCIIDSRKIACLKALPSDECGVRLHFESGVTDVVGFIVNKPQTVPSSLDLVHQIGLSTTDIENYGTIVDKKPMGGTSVRGLCVCGDAGDPVKVVTLAMAQGAICVDFVWGELVREESQKSRDTILRPDFIVTVYSPVKTWNLKNNWLRILNPARLSNKTLIPWLHNKVSIY